MVRLKHLIICFVSLPWDVLVAWPAVLLIRALWGHSLRWETPPLYTREEGGGGFPVLTCQIKPGSFPVTTGRWPRGWYLRDRKDASRPWGGTSLGHGIFYGPSIPEGWCVTRAHEHVHTEQMEVSMLGSFIIALVVGIVVFLLGHPVAAAILFEGIWFSGYLVMAISGWLTAILRGESAYWGSTHEESARGQTRKGNV